MLIYYRHSSDAGVTWGPETALTSAASYTTMTSLNGPYTDVVYGINNNPNFFVGIRQSSWMFPAFESVHVIAITLVVGSVMIVDLRVLGLASRNQRLRKY